MTALEKQPNLQREPFDISIFYNDSFEQSDGMDADIHEVCKDIILPVCSPSIAERLSHPSDLKNENCIHDSSWSEDWSNWITSALPNQSIKLTGPVFSLYGLAIEEARNGAGVMMGHQALVENDLENGRLVTPFKHSLKLNRALTISTAKSVKENPFLKLIIETLLKRAGN